MVGVDVSSLVVSIVLGASFARRSGEFYGVDFYGDLLTGPYRFAREFEADELGFGGLGSLQYVEELEILEQDLPDVFRTAGFSVISDGAAKNFQMEQSTRRLAEDPAPFLSSTGYFAVKEQVKGRGSLSGFFTVTMAGSNVTSKFLSVNASTADVQNAVIATAQQILGTASASITVTRSLTTNLTTQWNVSFPFQTSPVPLLTVDSTYLSGNGASGGAFRSRPGSSGLGGAFGVSFGNATSNVFRAVPVTADSVQAREILETLPGIQPGDVDVSAGGGNAYSGYGWRVTFQGNLAGQQPLLSVNASGLTGPGASVRMIEEQQGSFDQWMRPIPGDYLREPVPIPQSVSVSVDGIVGSCR
jgi:hypothetical protein